MSNYFACVVNQEQSESVRRWLRRYTEASEIRERRFENGSTAFVVSRCISEWESDGTFFKGTILSKTAAVLSPEGLKKFRQSDIRSEPLFECPEGEFICFDYTSGDFEVFRDLFGHARLAFTNILGGCAFSDSLLLLREFRRELNRPVTLNREVILARSLLNLFAYQQVSTDTVFNQIHFVPAGFRGKVSNLEFLPVPLNGKATSDEQNYEQQLYQASNAMLSQLHALSENGNRKLNLNLSGGMDSRAVLAASLFSGVTLSCTSGASVTSQSEDFEIAKYLSAKSNVPFKIDLRAEPDGATTDQLTGWGCSLAGFYDGFGVSRIKPRFPTVISLTGLGGELGRGTSWGWATIKEVISKVVNPEDFHTTTSQIEAFEEQFKKGLSALPDISADRSEIDGHYFAFRNGIHASAGHSLHDMHSLSPLANVPWFQLGRSENRRSHSKQMALDIILMFEPRLALEPFEGNRGFSTSEIATRLAELKNVPRPSSSPIVFGRTPTQGWGPSLLGMNIARRFGYVGEFSEERIEELALHSINALADPELEEIYSKLLKNSKWMIKKSSGSAFAAGPSTAKVSTLPLFVW